jgi:hypothetical protein
VLFDTTLRLNKSGYLRLTLVLPKPILCSSCEMSKIHKIPFDLNDKHALNPLDLIHCDLWGPSPVTSNSDYRTMYFLLMISVDSRGSIR